jgi:hypothetical protein
MENLESHQIRTAFASRAVVVLLVWMMGFLTVRSQEIMTLHKINREVIFDGIPDESFWQDIPPLPMVMLIPTAGNPQTFENDIRICYDDDFIYVGARLYVSDPSMIRRMGKRRDYIQSLYDYFVIIIDDSNDNETAVSFCTTPLDQRTDRAIKKDAMEFDDSWNTFWDTKSEVIDTCWNLEMRIPFSSLRFQQNDGQVYMGLTVFRWIPAINEMVVYPDRPGNWGFYGAWKPSLAQKVALSDIKSKNPVYFQPYLLAGVNQTNVLNNLNKEYSLDQKNTGEPGFDLKYSLSNSIILDLTANTDFAQVEADEQQINLTRFSLYFPEKRYFFLERGSIFDFKFGEINNLFYSRRIGLFADEPTRLFGGARVTGKIGEWDFGAMNMQTARQVKLGEEVLPSENFGVIRAMRKIINPYSTVGGIFTSRTDRNGNYNLAYGLDGLFRLYGDDYLTIRLAQTSENDRPIHSSLKPDRIFLDWERRNDRGFSFDLRFDYSGEEYNPGIGLQVRDNIYSFQSTLQYGWFPGQNSKLYNHKLALAGSNIYGVLDNNLESGNYEIAWYFQTKKMAEGTFMINRNLENLALRFPLSRDVYVNPGQHDFYGIYARYMTPFTKHIRSSFIVSAGEYYDGSRMNLTIFPFWNISHSFNISGMYRYDRIDFSERNQKLRNHIARINFGYDYSSKLSAVVFVQGNTAINGIITNFRLRYNPKEGKDLYIVYNDMRNTQVTREYPYLPGMNYRAFLVKYVYTFIL